MSVPILYKLSYNQRKIPKEHIEIWEVGGKDQLWIPAIENMHFIRD